MTLKFPFHLEHSPRCDVVREISNDRLDTTAIGAKTAATTVSNDFNRSCIARNTYLELRNIRKSIAQMRKKIPYLYACTGNIHYSSLQR